MIATKAPYNNPFNSRRISTIPYHFEKGGWKEFVIRLRKVNFRGAIIGPHGSGKTTLLEELGRELSRAGFVCCLISLNLESPKLSKQQWQKLYASARDQRVILFDGADMLSLYSQTWVKWVTRKSRGLIVTAHRPGLLPTVFECHPSEHLFSKLVAQLTADAVSDLPVDLGAIYQSHNLNMREAFRALYDHCAQ